MYARKYGDISHLLLYAASLFSWQQCATARLDCMPANQLNDNQELVTEHARFQ